MKRRHFVKLSGAAAASAFGIFPLLQSCVENEDMGRGMNDGNNMGMNMGMNPVVVKEGPFTSSLTFPIVMTSGFTLNAKTNTINRPNNQVTSVLGYSGGILGPTIKADKGTIVALRFQNDLSEETNIHWHGLLIPANMDGHPKNTVQSKAGFNFTLPLNQRAGTYWYHPHPHEKTAKQVFRGLAGFFIINDEEEKALKLPSGDQELLLVIQDKRFINGQLVYSPSMSEIMTGYTGEFVWVNGIYAPVQQVKAQHYRLRLLNGSNARVYDLALSNNQSFHVIGSDGGLISEPVAVNSILLAPGERADILVNFKDSLGKDIFLINKPFNGGFQGQQEFRIMKFVVNQDESDTFTLPYHLSNIPPIPPSSATKTRTITIGGMMQGMAGNRGIMGSGRNGMHSGLHTLNGLVYKMDRIDETVTAGETEIWEFDNSEGNEIHPMHLHGVQFQVLQRVGGRGSLIATEQGWKDTVLLLPGEKVKVIMTFPQEKGLFVCHCHNLEHEDSGMMLNYEIV